MVRLLAWTLLFSIASAAWAGRYPVPVNLSDHVGTARWIVVGTIDDKGRLAVVETIVGAKPPKSWEPSMRDEPPHSTGAKKPEFVAGRRFLVFIEPDGKARDWTSVHAVDAKGKVHANRVIGLGADLPAARTAIRKRIDPKYRAQLLETLRKGDVQQRDSAIRELTDLRCRKATPELIAIAAKGPRRLREVAVAHLWKLDDPKVAPTLVTALRSWETAGVANFALLKLRGAQRDGAIAFLLAATREKGDFATRARLMLKRMKSAQPD